MGRETALLDVFMLLFLIAVCNVGSRESLWDGAHLRSPESGLHDISLVDRVVEVQVGDTGAGYTVDDRACPAPADVIAALPGDAVIVLRAAASADCEHYEALELALQRAGLMYHRQAHVRPQQGGSP